MEDSECDSEVDDLGPWPLSDFMLLIAMFVLLFFIVPISVHGGIIFLLLFVLVLIFGICFIALIIRITKDHYHEKNSSNIRYMCSYSSVIWR